ncbi:hypothetical protein [Oceanirhabdus sp. W0125-5]|uniref:hypothetical protein n=1 Tax=Oceanirhabdus sp. W0125-5 TaxID=2999116 RepID=UPI0022F2F497|nr:hypothetical protein [Oceanirhabdus sp. W0125-5]WBW95901.1 hypothetical protein OW730_19745 [Oceanirhabdus sp. W0125-5]
MNLKEKYSGLLIALFYYGAIMSVIFILNGLKFSSKGWMLNIIMLGGYVFADTTLLNSESLKIQGILLAKGINFIFLIMFFFITLHFLPLSERLSFALEIGLKSLLITLFISVVITLIYWKVNEYEDRRNTVLVMVMFCFAAVLYGYIGLRMNFNNYVRAEIFNLGMELQKVNSMLKNDVDFQEILSELRDIENEILDPIEKDYINGGMDSFKKRVNTYMWSEWKDNSGEVNREFYEIICSRFTYNLWQFYDEKIITPTKVKKFLKKQEKYNRAYPWRVEEGVKPGVHNLIYEWSKGYDTVSRELLLLSLGYVDFSEIEEIEKTRGNINLYEAIINYDKFDDYDGMIIWEIFKGYKNSNGENKQEIEKGLKSIYLKKDYKELMIELAQRDEDFKELLDKFEGGE